MSRARSRIPTIPQCPSLPESHDQRIDPAPVVAHEHPELPEAGTRARPRCSWRRSGETRSSTASRPIRYTSSRITGLQRPGLAFDDDAIVGRARSPRAPGGMPEKACSRSCGALVDFAGPRTALRPSSMTVPSARARGRATASPASPPAGDPTATWSCIDALTKPCSKVSCSSCAIRVRSASRSSNRTFSAIGQLAHAQPIECDDSGHDRQHRGEPEPEGLPEGRNAGGRGDREHVRARSRQRVEDRCRHVTWFDEESSGIVRPDMGQAAPRRVGSNAGERLIPEGLHEPGAAPGEQHDPLPGTAVDDPPLDPHERGERTAGPRLRNVGEVDRGAGIRLTHAAAGEQDADHHRRGIPARRHSTRSMRENL